MSATHQVKAYVHVDELQDVLADHLRQREGSVLRCIGEPRRLKPIANGRDGGLLWSAGGAAVHAPSDH